MFSNSSHLIFHDVYKNRDATNFLQQQSCSQLASENIALGSVRKLHEISSQVCRTLAPSSTGISNSRV